MKKYILSLQIILIIFSFLGCEKTFDGVVDSENTEYKISGVNSFSGFSYAAGDSLITLRVTFLDNKGVTSVYSDVYSSENKKINSSPLGLLDNGKPANGDAAANDKIYSAVFPLSQAYPNGKYTVNYFVVDDKSETKLVATHSFDYDNGQANAAPVISDLSAPDTLNAIDTIKFSVRVKASDANGLNDIKRVYFVSYRPDGTTSGVQLDLLDNGNLVSNGDEIAGDGIFSINIQVDQNNMKGTYRFEFEAQDRRNVLSNKIIHNIVVN